MNRRLFPPLFSSAVARLGLLLALLMLLALVSVTRVGAEPAATKILYASPTGIKSGACTSWGTACTLAYALKQAVAPAEIWVKMGTHKPTTNDPDPRNATFKLKNGVALYGGFAGTETARTQRNYKTNVTILSGDIGVVGDMTDNTYHVVTGSGTDNTAVLDGVQVKFGYYSGGGSCPGVTCGAGMFNDTGSPTVNNVVFDHNRAGIAGGMYNSGSSPILTNVTFSNNVAQYMGGGMENINSSSPTLTNVTFTANSAYDGGAIYNLNSSSPALTNVTMSGNTASDAGGGIYVMILSTLDVTNITLTNVTMAGNTNYAIYINGMTNTSVTVKNSIIWDTTIYRGSSILNLSNTILDGGCPSGATCTNVQNVDPVLQPLANNGGFTKTMALGKDSSAINRANPADCPNKDQRGKLRRKAGGYCDNGAYEAQPSSFIAVAGSGQATYLHSGFPVPLISQVTDASGNGLAGLTITFLAPSTGASAMLDTSNAKTDLTGTAFALATANATLGAYAVTAKAPQLATPVTFNLANANTLENTHRAVSYDGWAGLASIPGSGGLVHTSNLANTIVTFPFSGTSITWVTTLCTQCGMAEVYIDGVSQGIKDLYNASTIPQMSLTYSNLANSPHTLTIRVTGTKNNASGNYWVVVDAFKVNGVKTEDSALKVQYGSWKGVSNASASGGSYQVSSTAGAITTLPFTGTSITWVTATGPNMGKAEVWIDGVLVKTEDLYTSTPTYQVTKKYGNLANAFHVLQIRALGTKNAKATDARVVVDGFRGAMSVQ